MKTDDRARTVLHGTLRLGSRLRHERPAGALTSNKIIVLGYLQRHGPSTPSAVATAEHQQLQALTRTFAELEDDGMITRARSQADRRASILSLTDTGRQALTEDLSQRARWLADALGELTETEQQLLVLASQLMNRLADTPAGSPPWPGNTGGRSAATHV
jgi:DNA-binding MarR family transcriptional regulator